MADIVTHPAIHRTPSTATWPAAPRALTLLAVVVAALISLGTSAGVADAFVAGAAPVAYVTSAAA